MIGEKKSLETNYEATSAFSICCILSILDITRELQSLPMDILKYDDPVITEPEEHWS